MLLENCKGGQQRLEDDDDWLRLLAAYPALTGESESGSCGCNYSCHPSGGGSICYPGGTRHSFLFFGSLSLLKVLISE